MTTNDNKKKEVEDVSMTTQKRKGKTIVQNLFTKLSNEYGDYPDEKMLIDELLKIEDSDFDELLK